MPRLPKGTTRNHYIHPKKNYHQIQHQQAGWDVAPIILSPNEVPSCQGKETNPYCEGDSGGRFWRARRLLWKTPRKLATLQLLGGGRRAKATANDVRPFSRNEDDSDDSAFSEPKRAPCTGDAFEVCEMDASASPVTTCSPLLWNESYLIVATLAGEINVFGNILPSSATTAVCRDINMDESSSPDSGIDSLSTIAPLASLALPHDATIVALQPLQPAGVLQSTSRELHDVFLALSTEGNIYRICLKKTDRHFNDKKGHLIDPNQRTRHSKRSSTNLTESDLETEGKKLESERKSGLSSTFYHYNLELQASWETQECGITSSTIMPTVTSQEAFDQLHIDSSREKLELVIGYHSGHLESWALDVASAQEPPTRLWRALVDKEESRSSVQAIGFLPRQLHPSASRVNLGSIVSQNPPHDKEKDEYLVSKTSPTIEEGGKKVIYDLVVTLQDWIGDDFPKIRVIDVSAIRHHLQSISSLTSRDRVKFRQQVGNQRAGFLPTSLAQFHLHPDPSMELFDNNDPYLLSSVPAEPHGHPSSMATDRPMKSPLVHVASTGTNQIVPLYGVSSSQQLDEYESKDRMHLRCGVALSNGAAVILSTGWGAEDDTSEVLFSYPVIGLGRVLLPRYGEERVGGGEQPTSSLPLRQRPAIDQAPFQQEYMVCCLRAGTCYFIPTTSRSTEDGFRAIPVMSYPHDNDMDTTGLYVQAFTAGSLRNPAFDNTTTTFDEEQAERQHASLVPVLIFVLPGGFIDVYSCVLPIMNAKDALKSNASIHSPPEEDQVLADLFWQSTEQNNSRSKSLLGRVLQILESMGLEELHNRLHLDKFWLQARQEMTEFKARMGTVKDQAGDGIIADSGPKTLADLKDRPMLCNLLLHLAQKEPLL